MKITVGQLRKIIKEAIRQQTSKPGSVMPGWGGRLDDEEQQRLAYGGFLGVDENDEVDELDEDDRENTNQ